MQFITTDQRIAVENFEVGLIYTVTFSNGGSFTGACIGIGPDFVAFQRTAPKLLFCLTMTTAADVASIEPLSVDIGKILAYTGSVPVSIKTDGTPLIDYIISGNTTQNGTPTPDNPIMPQGCGELEAGQYKIPILSNSTTTPIYLGEVQTTRKIKKYECTGVESWSVNSGQGKTRAVANFTTSMGIVPLSKVVCTHYIGGEGGAGYPGINTITVNNNGTLIIGISSEYTDTNAFKAYLAAQYAAGTPVTIWYVLATEETAVVNEPLMRIGDYADTLSFIQSGIKIPTTDGLDIFDIDTTVKPSEVYLKYFSPIF